MRRPRQCLVPVAPQCGRIQFMLTFRNLKRESNSEFMKPVGGRRSPTTHQLISLMTASSIQSV